MSTVSPPTWHVCLVTDVYPPNCGGSGWSTHALATVLRDRGHRVSIVVMDPTRTDVFTRTYDRRDMTVVGVRAARRSARSRLGARDYAHETLARYLDQRFEREPSVDVVHAQHMHSGPPAVAAGNAHGVATVVTVRDYWPVCLHGTSWWGDRQCDGCTADSLTGCMTEYWHWPRPASRLMVGWARRRLDSRASALIASDKVVSVSHTVERRIQDQLPGADLSIVPNIVDPRHCEAIAAAQEGKGPSEPYVLAAGKLQPTKGFDMLFSALAMTKATRRLASIPPVLIAGDGPSRATLEAQARDSDLPVTFLGWVDHDRLLGLQRAAQAVLLPSAWQEPLSRVVLETMALGTPVVAWDRGGNAEMIESGVNGWLVRQPDELGEILLELARSHVRDRVGAAARSRVHAQFSPEVVYPQVAAVYKAAISNSGRRGR